MKQLYFFVTAILTLFSVEPFTQVVNNNINFEYGATNFWSGADGDDQLLYGMDEINIVNHLYLDGVWVHSACHAWSCHAPCLDDISNSSQGVGTGYSFGTSVNFWIEGWERDAGSEDCYYNSNNDDLYVGEWAATMATNNVITTNRLPGIWHSNFGSSGWINLTEDAISDVIPIFVWRYTAGNTQSNALDFGSLGVNEFVWNDNSNLSPQSGVSAETTYYHDNSGNSSRDVHYKFNLLESAVVNLTTDAGVTNFDTQLNLYDSNGNWINMNDDIDYPNNLASELNIALCAGTYYVMIEGYVNNDEEEEGFFTLEIDTSPVSISLETASSAASCLNSNNGSASVLASGGIGWYDYDWDDGSTSFLNINLEPGVYSVTVTDECGNSATASVTVENGDNNAPDITCGSIDVVVIEGQTYVLNSPEQAQLATATDNCDTPDYGYSDILFTDADEGSNPVTVTAEDAAGNESSCVATVNVSVATSIEHHELPLQAAVFPNPFSDDLNLSFENVLSHGPVQLSVFNLNGQLVHQKILNLAEGHNQVVNLGHLSKGTYVVRLYDNHSTIEKRVTKM